jgi:hypothetical protein
VKGMDVTAPFLKKLNAALKILAKKFVSNFTKIRHSREALMLSYSEKDGQT